MNLVIFCILNKHFGKTRELNVTYEVHYLNVISNIKNFKTHLHFKKESLENTES